jgi:hypothetical protein
VTLTREIDSKIYMHRQPLLVIDGHHLICIGGDEGCAFQVLLQALGANSSHGICKLLATRLAPIFSWDLRHHQDDQQLMKDSEICHGPPLLEDME